MKEEKDKEKEQEDAYHEEMARIEAQNPPCKIHDAIGCTICNGWVKA